MAEDERDKTQLGPKAPPKLPGAGPKPTPEAPATSPPPGPSPGDSTRPAAAPPPLLKPPSHQQPTPTPEPEVPAPKSEAVDDDEATVFDVRPRSSIRLQRVQPPGHSEIMTLDRSSYLFGRLPTCDIKLFTQSASREHARLLNVAGTWHIEPIGDRIVLVNGAPIQGQTALAHKAVVKLGGDELIFLDERAALAAPAPGAAQPEHHGHFGWIVLLVALLGVLLAAGAWWSLQP